MRVIFIFIFLTRVTLLSGKPPGSYFKEGDTQIMYKARDSTGLTDYCFFIISVTGNCSQINYCIHLIMDTIN